MSRLLFVIFGVFTTGLHAQTTDTLIGGVINSYTRITQIASSNVIVVSEATDFGPCDKVLIIQMKGANINTSDNANFGTITDLGGAGFYEFSFVQSINNNTIVLTTNLVNDYNVAEAVQLVRVPVFENATINSPLTCKAWDGFTGGVLAFDCLFTLTLNESLDISAKGFQTFHTFHNDAGCTTTGYRFPIGSQVAGRKGESIVSNTSNFACGRGRLATGGGGGNRHNGGGGGGSNAGSGGLGGNEWEGCSRDQLGGIGGLAIPYAPNVNRALLGGGGGSPHDNNRDSKGGGNGGGILMLTAARIINNGFSITAAGESILERGGNDGGGGGGGGGSIFLDVEQVEGEVLNCNVAGGDGNSLSPGNCHGPGGGGGGGIVRLKNNLITNLNLVVDGGIAGTINSAGSFCHNQSYGAQSGRAGIVYYTLNFIVGNPPIDTSLNFQQRTACVRETIQFEVPTFNNVSYEWRGPNGFVSTLAQPLLTEISDADAGVYNLVINLASNCTKLGFLIDLEIKASPYLEVSPDTSICLGQTAMLRIDTSNAPFLWLNNSTDTILLVSQSGFYSAIATNDCGSFVDEVELVVREDCIFDCPIYAPNAFTPNQDGTNESFFILGPCQVQQFQLNIYNRWGEMIFSTTQPTGKWDGKYKGRPQQQGVYVWRVVTNLINDVGALQQKQETGFITLIR